MSASPAIDVIRISDEPAVRAARATVAIAFGVAVLTVSAKIQIPFHPVPMTMQSAVVLVLGALLGPRLGAATAASYVLMGFVGAPVFAKPPFGGAAYLLGPTGGYLLGFIAAAFWMGLAAMRGWIKGPITAFMVSVFGMALLYLLGLAQLGFVIGWGPAVWTAGAAPFLLGALTKSVLAAGVLSLRAARRP